MSKGFQAFLQQLGTFTLSANADMVAKLRDLTSHINGRAAHLIGFLIQVGWEPTFTTAPTVVQAQKVLSLIEFSDGHTVRFRGSGSDLRAHLRLEQGQAYDGEGQFAAASTNRRYWRRFLPVGPPHFAGNPSDFAIPNVLLGNGELRLKGPALTDLSADCTALTGEVIVTAVMVPLDEARIPSFYERATFTVSSDDRISGEGLYAYVGVSKSAAHGAFAAGEVGSVLIESGKFSVVPTVNPAILTSAFNHQMKSGFAGLQGEPVNATYDTPQREPNYGGATALLAGVADLQPLVWCEPGCRLSKVAVEVAKTLRVKLGGTVTSGLRMHVGRFLPQEDATIDAQVKVLRDELGATGKLSFKTLSKQPYAGPRARYMPFSLKMRPS